jgi:hypothetical protein
VTVAGGGATPQSSYYIIVVDTNYTPSWDTTATLQQATVAQASTDTQRASDHDGSDSGELIFEIRSEPFSGVYIVRMTAGDYLQTRRVALVR